jgi:DNA-binding transcriptional ArsR family regulator
VETEHSGQAHQGFVCVLLSIGGFYNASKTGEPNWLAGVLLPLGLGMFLVALVWSVRSRVAPGPRKRREIVAYLAEYSERHGEPPTVPEVAAAVAISESAVEEHVEKLKRAGLIGASEPDAAEPEVARM